MTNDPKVVIEEVVSSLKRRHNAEDRELSDYTKHLISQLSKPYNRTQRGDIHSTPLTIRELDEVLHKLKRGKTRGEDGLPAELYRRLPLYLKRPLGARLWNVAIRRADTQHCAPGNLTDALSLFGLSHQLDLFVSIFFRTIKARAQDLSRMKGLCTLVILRSATGLQTDFRQARLFQSLFLYAPALAHLSLLNPLVLFVNVSFFVILPFALV